MTEPDSDVAEARRRSLALVTDALPLPKIKQFPRKYAKDGSYKPLGIVHYVDFNAGWSSAKCGSVHEDPKVGWFGRNVSDDLQDVTCKVCRSHFIGAPGHLKVVE